MLQASLIRSAATALGLVLLTACTGPLPDQHYPNVIYVSVPRPVSPEVWPATQLPETDTVAQPPAPRPLISYRPPPEQLAPGPERPAPAPRPLKPQPQEARSDCYGWWRLCHLWN